MITFTTRVQIDRPLSEVFQYVADGQHLPHWNSAVQAVNRLGGTTGTAVRYWMGRQLPQGAVENEVLITIHEPDRALTIETLSGPTPFVYRYSFAPAGRGTRITLEAEVKLANLPALLGPVMGLGIRRGVDANLATLKRILEVAQPVTLPAL